MARFVFRKDEYGGKSVILDAEDGEELPVDMVLAYANLRQSWELEAIANNIIGLDNAVNGLGPALFDR